jgi:hypothetical protein
VFNGECIDLIPDQEEVIDTWSAQLEDVDGAVGKTIELDVVVGAAVGAAVGATVGAAVGAAVGEAKPF